MQISNFYFTAFSSLIYDIQKYIIYSLSNFWASPHSRKSQIVSNSIKEEKCVGQFFVAEKRRKKESEEKNNVKGQTLKIMYLFCNLLLYGTLFLFLKVRKRAS